jgi:hypothetical protein
LENSEKSCLFSINFQPGTRWKIHNIFTTFPVCEKLKRKLKRGEKALKISQGENIEALVIAASDKHATRLCNVFAESSPRHRRSRILISKNGLIGVSLMM